MVFFQLKSLLRLMLAGPALFICACADKSTETPPGPFPLTIHFSEMGPNLGRIFTLKVVEIESGAVAADTTIPYLLQEYFSISFPGLLRSGADYHIDFYSDFNRNGNYDAPPRDQAWRLSAMGVFKEVNFEFSHNRNFMDVNFMSAESFNFAVDFYQMAPLAGQLFSLRLINAFYGTAVAETTLAAIPADSFKLDLGNTLVAGQIYQVDFYADSNGNHGYDSPPADQAWRIPLGPAAADTNLVFIRNDLYTDIGFPADSLFSLSLRFDGMNEHMFRSLVVRVIDLSRDSIIIQQEGVINLSGRYIADLGEILPEGGSYNIDFFLDVNNNQGYDPPPVDNAWRLPLAGVSSDTTVSFSFNAAFTDIGLPPDSIFDLRLDVRELSSHAGEMVRLRVISRSDDSVVAEKKIQQLSAADTAILWENILNQGKFYRVAFFTDQNKNGTYDENDSAWQINVDSAISNIALYFNRGIFLPDTHITDAAFSADSLFNLELSFSGMNAHVNQVFEIKVIDKIYGRAVAEKYLPYVPQSDFSLDLGDILVSHRSYMIDFYADYNNNGTYDAPPADFAWRIELSGVTADESVDFVHNIHFTDIGFPAASMPFMNVSFPSMDNYLGNFFRLQVTDISPSRVVADTSLAAIPSAAFSVSLGSILMTGRNYQVDLFVDMNGNSSYDPPPADHAWRRFITADADTLNMAIIPDSIFTDIQSF